MGDGIQGCGKLLKPLWQDGVASELIKHAVREAWDYVRRPIGKERIIILRTCPGFLNLNGMQLETTTLKATSGTEDSEKHKIYLKKTH